MVGALAVCVVAVAAVIGFLITRPGPARDVRYHRGDSVVSGDSVVRGDTYHYLVFVPASYRAASKVPLVVVLHGCQTTASQQAVASGYGAIAEQRRFLVLYPEVDQVDQARGGCWKGIWEPAEEGRDRGDAGAIASMTATVMRTLRIDPTRVYVIGISAGAFESAILGADYPDLYAAIGIHSGAAYSGGGPGCLTAGVSASTTAALAHAALAAMGRHARMMPVIVLHGDQDQVIPYRCGEQALRQWLGTDQLVAERQDGSAPPVGPATVRAGVVAGGHTYTVASYPDQQGCTLAQLWTIHGMGHAWSGGSHDPSVAPYTDPRGPSAAAASSSFFLQWKLSRGRSVCSREQGNAARRAAGSLQEQYAG